jgi:beta-phosphoglucomutase-like phosphatase (HAD superfamily)
MVVNMIDLPTPQLIIFDYDGTIVDTEDLNNMSFYEVLQEIGSPPPYEEASKLFMGRSLEKCIEIAMTFEGLKSANPDFIRNAWIERAYAALLDSEENFNVPGAKEGMLELSRSYHIAVGTNALKQHADLKMEKGGFYTDIKELQLYSYECVENAKPAPDLFLYIANHFGVAPSDTWVIEDTVTGARAGVAAGMTTFGFTGCCTDKEASARELKAAGAICIFDDYKSL